MISTTRRALVCLLLVISASAVAQSAQELREALAHERLRAVAKALGANDAHAILRAMDPDHLISNIGVLPGFDINDRYSVDLAITAWALFPAANAPFLASIWQIESVEAIALDATGETWTATFTVTLGNGARAEYRTYMHPDTLLIFGASG